MFYRFVAFSGNTEVNIGSNFPTQSLAIYFLKKKKKNSHKSQISISFFFFLISSVSSHLNFIQNFSEFERK